MNAFASPLLEGVYVPLNKNNPSVLSYLRREKGETVLVLLNMTAPPQKVAFNLLLPGLTPAKMTSLLTDSTACIQLDQAKALLEPFAVYIARITK